MHLCRFVADLSREGTAQIFRPTGTKRAYLRRGPLRKSVFRSCMRCWRFVADLSPRLSPHRCLVLGPSRSPAYNATPHPYPDANPYGIACRGTVIVIDASSLRGRDAYGARPVVVSICGRPCLGKGERW